MIDGHLDEPELSPARLASLLHIGRSTLYRRVGAQFNASVSGLIYERRLLRARTLLETTDQTVMAVARAVGFQGQSHFSRRFRRRFGLSPTEYRHTDGLGRSD